MRVLVVYLVDGVVTEDTIEADRVRCKIHPDGRGHVDADGTLHMYRQVEKITRYGDELKSD